MEKTNNYSNFIERIGVLKFVNIGTFLAIAFMYVTMAFEDAAMIEELKQVAPSLATPLGIILIIVGVTLLIVVLNYKILQMIFRVSIAAIENEEVLFIYLTTTLFGSLVTAVMKMFGVPDTVEMQVCLSVVRALALLMLTQSIVGHKRQTMTIPSKSMLTFTLLFGFYSLLEIVYIFVRFNDIV